MIRQEVNLHVVVAPRRMPLGAGQSLLILVVVLMTTLAVWGGLEYQLRGVSTEHQALETQVREREDRVAALRGQLAERRADPELRRQAADLEEALEARQKYGRLLEQLSPERRIAFSELLQGLADQSLEELWLTGFEFRDKGRRLHLQGRVLEAQAVPRYLRRLGRERLYAGAHFDDLELQEDPQGLNFTLDARLETAGRQP